MDILFTSLNLYLIVSLMILSLGSLSSLLCIFTCYLDGSNYNLKSFFHFLREDEEDNLKWSLSKSLVFSFTWPKYVFKFIANIGKTIEF